MANHIECWYCGEYYDSTRRYICPICETNMYSDPVYDEKALFDGDEEDEEVEDDELIIDDDTADNYTSPPEVPNDLPF